MQGHIFTLKRAETKQHSLHSLQLWLFSYLPTLKFSILKLLFSLQHATPFSVLAMCVSHNNKKKEGGRIKSLWQKHVNMSADWQSQVHRANPYFFYTIFLMAPLPQQFLPPLAYIVVLSSSDRDLA